MHGPYSLNIVYLNWTDFTRRFGKSINYLDAVMLKDFLLVQRSNAFQRLYANKQISSRTSITDIPDALSPPFPIAHCLRQVFRATPHIDTELQYVGSNWSSCLCSSTLSSPQKYMTYELVPISPAMSCMSGSSNFDNLCLITCVILKTKSNWQFEFVNELRKNLNIISVHWENNWFFMPIILG